jgi:hypothetical protein
MKPIITLFAFLAAILPLSVVTAAPAPIPPQLRQGVECDTATIATAVEMVSQGWVYIMPQPKSAKAAWGNRDGRTTWFVGYWTNSKTKQTSAATPTRNKDGKYVGDDNGHRGWRRGGSPRSPTMIEWLCSKSGGIKPLSSK